MSLQERRANSPSGEQGLHIDIKRSADDDERSTEEDAILLPSNPEIVLLFSPGPLLFSASGPFVDICATVGWFGLVFSVCSLLLLTTLTTHASKGNATTAEKVAIAVVAIEIVVWLPHLLFTMSAISLKNYICTGRQRLLEAQTVEVVDEGLTSSAKKAASDAQVRERLSFHQSLQQSTADLSAMQRWAAVSAQISCSATVLCAFLLEICATPDFSPMLPAVESIFSVLILSVAISVANMKSTIPLVGINLGLSFAALIVVGLRRSLQISSMSIDAGRLGPVIDSDRGIRLAGAAMSILPVSAASVLVLLQVIWPLGIQIRTANGSLQQAYQSVLALGRFELDAAAKPLIEPQGVSNGDAKENNDPAFVNPLLTEVLRRAVLNIEAVAPHIPQVVKEAAVSRWPKQFVAVVHSPKSGEFAKTTSHEFDAARQPSSVVPLPKTSGKGRIQRPTEVCNFGPKRQNTVSTIADTEESLHAYGDEDDEDDLDMDAMIYQTTMEQSHVSSNSNSNSRAFASPLSSLRKGVRNVVKGLHKKPSDTYAPSGPNSRTSSEIRTTSQSAAFSPRNNARSQSRAAVPHPPSPINMVNQEMTIALVDVSIDYVAVNEDASLLRQITAGLATRAVTLANKHGGVVNSFIGDRLFVSWNAVRPTNRMEVRAARFMVAIREQNQLAAMLSAKSAAAQHFEIAGITEVLSSSVLTDVGSLLGRPEGLSSSASIRVDRAPLHSPALSGMASPSIGSSRLGAGTTGRDGRVPSTTFSGAQSFRGEVVTPISIDDYVRVTGAVVTCHGRFQYAGNDKMQLAALSFLKRDALAAMVLLGRKLNAVVIDESTKNNVEFDFATRGFDSIVDPATVDDDDAEVPLTALTRKEFDASARHESVTSIAPAARRTSGGGEEGAVDGETPTATNHGWSPAELPLELGLGDLNAPDATAHKTLHGPMSPASSSGGSPTLKPAKRSESISSAFAKQHRQLKPHKTEMIVHTQHQQKEHPPKVKQTMLLYELLTEAAAIDGNEDDGALDKEWMYQLQNQQHENPNVMVTRATEIAASSGDFVLAKEMLQSAIDLQRSIDQSGLAARRRASKAELPIATFRRSLLSVEGAPTVAHLRTKLERAANLRRQLALQGGVSKAPRNSTDAEASPKLPNGSFAAIPGLLANLGSPPAPSKSTGMFEPTSTAIEGSLPQEGPEEAQADPREQARSEPGPASMRDPQHPPLGGTNTSARTTLDPGFLFSSV